jgi:hypothetical protein
MSQLICQQIAGWVMGDEVKVVLALIAVMLTIGGQTWAIITYFQRRQDELEKKLDDKVKAFGDRSGTDITTLHNRINDVKDTYVKRTELDRDFINLQKSMSDMKGDLHRAIDGMNLRFDQLVSLIRKATE